MNNEQENHMTENFMDFQKKYISKYVAGQKAHGGSMWTMGAYQALENAEEECLDNWSYLRQIRKCLDEIEDALDEEQSAYHDGTEVDWTKFRKILNRNKDDNNLDEPIGYEVVE